MKWTLDISTFPISIGAPGIILNILILTIYLRDWCKGKRPTARDLILSSMTFTNIVFQNMLISFGVLYHIQTIAMLPKGLYFFIFVTVSFVIYTSFWQTALLSTYYLIKLFNFSHSLFQWVKKKISTSINLLLLGSAAFCFLISLPLIWVVRLNNPENVTELVTSSDYIISFNNYFNLFNMLFGCCLPFTVTYICITLSIGSLLKHVWNIKRNALQLSSTPQTGSLVRAVVTMVVCALLELVFCGNVVGQLSSNFIYGDVVAIINWAIVTLYPTARSIVLIIGNPQLKNQLGAICASS